MHNTPIDITKKDYMSTIMKISQHTQCITYFANYSVSSKKYDCKVLCVTRNLTKSSSFLSTFLCIIILL
jgi:hypothetical protein